jgi:acyl carrier protein
MMTIETIEKDVIQILTDMTQDWDTEFAGGIGADTRLVADLGFESIDVVMLIGEVQRHYNRRKLPFERLFVKEGGGFVDDVRVSALARFLHRELAGGAA